MVVAETGFIVTAGIAVLFTVLTIYRQSKFSAIYSTLGFVFWFALAGINLYVFANDPPLLMLSYLWFAIGVVVEILGLVISLQNLKTDRENREMQL